MIKNAMGYEKSAERITFFIPLFSAVEQTPISQSI